MTRTHTHTVCGQGGEKGGKKAKRGSARFSHKKATARRRSGEKGGDETGATRAQDSGADKDKAASDPSEEDRLRKHITSHGGLRQDGDLWENIWKPSCTRGVSSFRIAKVTGHAAYKRVSDGKHYRTQERE